MLNIILAILVLAFLIFFHELGHFTVGKLLGFRVLGFSMGFGPALVKFKKGDTEYALRAIPFGGSCQFDGEDEDAETDPKRFNAQPVWKRFLVILAGPFMNVLLAFLISFILMLAVPVPIYAVDAGSGDNIPYIVDVVEGSAAEKAGILPGDIVIAVDGKNTMDANDGIESIDALVKFIGEASNDLYITIDRDGVVADLFAQDVYNAELGRNQLGISIAAVIENTKYLTVDKALTGSSEYTGQILTPTAN